jgi:threonine/homoserine/homoserine lactone efflux protein
MGATIGELLPLAVGVAVSPIPIIATILMLLAPHARAASAGFAAGWLVGIVIVVTVVAVVAASADLGGTADDPSTGASWVKLVIGVLLVLLAGRQWSKRPRGDQPGSMPTWMTAIDSMTVGKAAGLGFLLAAVNPKNLLLCLSAGVTLAACLAGTRSWPARSSSSSPPPRC